MRRANGTGSVYKLSGNRKRPWIAVKSIEKAGDLERVPLGTYETKKEAEQALAQTNLHPLSSDYNATLMQVFESWKKTPGYVEISKQTKQNYEAAFLHMAKYHDVKFSNLKRAHFQNIIDIAEKRGRTDTVIRKLKAKENNKQEKYRMSPENIKKKTSELNATPKGLGRSSLSKIKTLIGLLSEYAYDEDIVHKTYYSKIRIPKEGAKQPIDTFSDLERKILFNNDEDDIVKTILILIYTGMRVTEMLTLSKFYIDITNWVITGGIKTDAGKDRPIPIHTRIRPYIKYFYYKSEKYLIEWDRPIGNVKKNTKRIVKSKYRYEYYRDKYDAALERLDIRPLTPHKARHTFFTRMDGTCTDDWAMAVVGGHTDPNFSKKKYSHPDIERLRRVIESVD